MYKTFFFASGILIAGFANTVKAQEPDNLAAHKKAIVEYHDSGEYDKDVRGIVASAQKYLALRITENEQQQKPKKLAIVFDIDETTLSNYDYMKKHDFGGTLLAFDNNVLKHRLPAIKAVKSLYDFAQRNKVSIFFVTGRKPLTRLATVTNLKSAGYNKWQQVYFKPQRYQKGSVVAYKAGIRKQIETKGYTIVENIGDQKSDLDGGHAEKSYKLPNPYYYIP